MPLLLPLLTDRPQVDTARPFFGHGGSAIGPFLTLGNVFGGLALAAIRNAVDCHFLQIKIQSYEEQKKKNAGDMNQCRGRVERCVDDASLRYKA